jgi:hypothetical protein
MEVPWVTGTGILRPFFKAIIIYKQQKMKRFTLLFAACMMLLSHFTFAQNSEKITRVLEYKPAPGQHINRLFPTPAMSDTYANALTFASSKLVNNTSMLGLGAFGGYVVVGFDHPIVNVPGEYDFKALGNAYTNNSEPGIVMVCQDLNKNGQPDVNEPWYELAGSEYNHAQTVHNYEITYYRPQPASGDVRWTDNQGGEGFVYRNSYHQQDSYYPNWIKEDEITFRGTRLKDNAINEGGTWVGYCYPWGYADNHPNRSEFSQFKIDWAVDQNGNHVELDKIDFVKIYTAVNQNVGWMGEISTEVMTVEDLHFEN